MASVFAFVSTLLLPGRSSGLHDGPADGGYHRRHYRVSNSFDSQSVGTSSQPEW